MLPHPREHKIQNSGRASSTAVKTNKGRMGKADFALFTTVGNFLRATFHTGRNCLVSINRSQQKSTNHPMFPSHPFLSKCWLKENLTGQRKTLGNVTVKEVLTLSCVSDWACASGLDSGGAWLCFKAAEAHSAAMESWPGLGRSWVIFIYKWGIFWKSPSPPKPRWDRGSGTVKDDSKYSVQ